MKLKDPKKIRVDYKSDALKETDVDYLEYNGEPFNGYAVYDYFKPEDNADINVQSEGEYRDGFMMGWDREYYPNGNIKQESLNYFETTLLIIEYNDLGIETSRSIIVSQEFYDRILNTYNIIDK